MRDMFKVKQKEDGVIGNYRKFFLKNRRYLQEFSRRSFSRAEVFFQDRRFINEKKA